jgi:hypothetical protein
LREARCEHDFNRLNQWDKYDFRVMGAKCRSDMELQPGWSQPIPARR